MKSKILFRVFIVLLSLWLCSCTRTVLVSGISLDATSISMIEGESTSIVASITPENADNQFVLWSSDNPSSVTVSNGIVKAVSAGTAYVTATSEDGGKTATCFVSVRSQSVPLERMSLNKDRCELYEDEAEQLEAELFPMNTTETSLEWSSSDESVATVDADGLVTAVSAGEAVITVKCGEITASCPFTIVKLPEPLTFTAEGRSSVSLAAHGTPPSCELLYRMGDADWLPYEVGETIALEDGESVSFLRVGKGELSESTKSYHYFKMTGRISASGNILSLVDEHRKPEYVFFPYLFLNCSSLLTAPELPVKNLSNDCFHGMFKKCTSLTNAPALPSGELAKNCYHSMFSGCSSLEEAPELPATVLPEGCYEFMFYNCESLKNAPELPASKLGDYCYRSMFSGCSSITTAPELRARTLAFFCYSAMFSGCTSLVNAPELPSATLAWGCYMDMFYGCISLRVAPDLPATRLADYCYHGMFQGCTSLQSVKALFKSTIGIADDTLEHWLPETGGTFFRSPDATWTRNDAEIPDGWTIIDVE